MIYKTTTYRSALISAVHRAFIGEDERPPLTDRMSDFHTDGRLLPGNAPDK